MVLVRFEGTLHYALYDADGPLRWHGNVTTDGPGGLSHFLLMAGKTHTFCMLPLNGGPLPRDYHEFTMFGGDR